MKNRYLIYEYVLLPVSLMLLVPFLALWLSPEISRGEVLLLPAWIAGIAIASFISYRLYRKTGVTRAKDLLTIPGIILLIIFAWFLSLRISSMMTNPVHAWDVRWIGLSITFIYFTLDFGIHYLIGKSRESFNTLDNRLSMKEHELDIMKNQLSPHFLFNSLNNIAATIMVDKEMALDYIYKLSELLRFQNGISGRETVPVEEEVNFIRTFLNIEKFRLGERCDIQFNSEVEEPLTMIPPLLLHPFIEHSLRRSLGLNGKSFLNVQINSDREIIRMTVTNSLPENPAYPKLTGAGVKMLKKRLNLLYPKSHILKTSKNRTEYVLELEIRLGN